MKHEYLKIASRISSENRKQKKTIIVYHTTKSIHALRGLLKNFQSVVSDFNPEIGQKRLSVSTNLQSALTDWYFGPYIIELEVTIDEERGTIGNELVLYDNDEVTPLRWGIGFNIPVQPAKIEWFPMSDLKSFNHKKWDKRVLEETEKGHNSSIGMSWMMDFFGGEWPEFEAIIDSKNDNLKAYFKDFKNIKDKDWNTRFRKNLYGID